MSEEELTRRSRANRPMERAFMILMFIGAGCACVVIAMSVL